jgi:hypothetical protein
MKLIIERHRAAGHLRPRVSDMLSPAQGLLRGLRAASLGVVSFLLALAAHVAAGGAAPGPLVVLLLAGLIGAAAVLLTGARLSPVRVVASLAVMQVFLHEALTRLSGPADCLMAGASEPAGGHLGMGQGARLVLDCTTALTHPGMVRGSMSSTVSMLGVHVAATAVMAALLAYGDRVLWALAAWVCPALRLPVGLPELPAARVFSSGAPPMLRVRFPCGGVGRRGPPPRVLLAIV